jgi:hypothetical protein
MACAELDREQRERPREQPRRAGIAALEVVDPQVVERHRELGVRLAEDLLLDRQRIAIPALGGAPTREARQAVEHDRYLVVHTAMHAAVAAQGAAVEPLRFLPLPGPVEDGLLSDN